MRRLNIAKYDGGTRYSMDGALCLIQGIFKEDEYGLQSC